MSSFSDEDDESIVVVVPAPTADVPTQPKPKTKRQSFPRLQKGNGYPFLEECDVKDLTIFKGLAVSQPFAVGKGKGLTTAWANAVAEMNEQLNPVTGEHVFDPPIAVKTVRDRFEGAMKVIAKIDNSIPFRSGTDDEDSPNELRGLLEDLLSQKKDAESAAAEVKDGTMAKKKQDREAAKEIQLAALGIWSSAEVLSESESADESPESGDTKKPLGKRKSTSDTNNTASIKEMLEERRIDRVNKANLRAQERAQQQAQQRELAERQLAQQQQLADRQSEQADRQAAQADRQMEVTLQMCAMLKGLTEKLSSNNN